MFKKRNKLCFFVKIIILLFFTYFLFYSININIQHYKIVLTNQNKYNNNKNKNITFIDIDNEFYLFENNVDYSNYTTDIKAIALYLPQFHFIKENNEWWGENFTEWTNVRISKPLYKGHHQPRKPGDEEGYLGYYFLTNALIIKKQVKLAKSHGIYGFGIYYYWFSGRRLLEKPLDIYINNKDIDFPFLLIWANENWSKNWNGGNRNILIKQEYKIKDPENFIKDIKKYIIDHRYIKINGKSLIGIYEPLKIPNLKETISIWRKMAKLYEIGELYIITSLNGYNIKVFKNLNIFDAAYDFPPRNIFKYIKNHNFYNFLIYKNKNFINLTNEFPVFRGSMLEWDNTPRRGKNGVIFREYSPEKFYILNKMIIQYTKTHYNSSNRLIFINAWNEWGEGTYLEPDEKYGYSSINALSKALFNLPYIFINITNLNLTKSSQIAVQINIYYDDIINDIIYKINNIPLKFDLFIFITLFKEKKLIEEILKKFSNYNKYYIILVDKNTKNINQYFKLYNVKIKKYKYICHINANNMNKLNQNLKNYMYNNIIGNKNIILDILSYFEKYKSLGLAYPEANYNFLSKRLNNDEIICINNILKIIFPKKNYKLGKKNEYPQLYIFWVKVESIYQIFKDNLYKEFLKIRDKDFRKIIQNIEIIYFYLIKINGYYYQKIIKYF